MTAEDVKSLLVASAGLKAYGVYLGIMMGCSFGFPFNSDILMVIGGALAALGLFDIKLLILLVPVALLLGDTVTYNLGRRLGPKILSSRLVLKAIPQHKQTKLLAFMQNNSKQFVFMIRFIPGVRTFLFLFVGCVQVKPKIFYQMNAISTVLYAPTILVLSYMTASELSESSGEQNYIKWVMTLAIFFSLVTVIRSVSKKFMMQAEGAE